MYIYFLAGETSEKKPKKEKKKKKEKKREKTTDEVQRMIRALAVNSIPYKCWNEFRDIFKHLSTTGTQY